MLYEFIAVLCSLLCLPAMEEAWGLQDMQNGI